MLFDLVMSLRLALVTWATFALGGCGGGGSSRIDAAAPDAAAPDGPRPDARVDGPPGDGLTPDGPPGDASPTLIQLSKYPRGGNTFMALSNGSHLPYLTGIQGFKLAELSVRVPAGAALTSQAAFNLSYEIPSTGMPPSMQTNPLVFTMPPAGGVRDSNRYVIFFNQFSDLELSGASCHITANLPNAPSAGTVDLTVTLDHSACVDTGPDVVCPDGGVP